MSNVRVSWHDWPNDRPDLYGLPTYTCNRTAAGSNVAANLGRPERSRILQTAATHTSITLTVAPPASRIEGISCVAVLGDFLADNATVEFRLGATLVGSASCNWTADAERYGLYNPDSPGFSPQYLTAESSVDAGSYAPPAGTGVEAQTAGTGFVLWMTGLTGAPQVIPCDLVTITLTRTYAATWKISRLWAGSTWEPAVNASYPIESGIIDTSVHARTVGGSIRTRMGAVYRRLSLPLRYLSDEEITTLMRNTRYMRPRKNECLVSIYPGAGGSREPENQWIGRITGDVGLDRTRFDRWSTTLTIEEI